MSGRPAVLRNIKRKLWAEAIGHCMNPDCQSELIENDTNVGQMAHIEPHAAGGDGSFENLILLCSKCHTQTDQNRTDGSISRLRQWKNNRNKEITERFERRYKSFDKLKQVVTPILERNGQIFDSYGPTNDEPNSAERHKLWLKFEGQIISNNQRLELILKQNKHLFPKQNWEIVQDFVQHAREFVLTRNDNQIPRVCLFPQKLLSIFGIAEALVGFPPNISALQNFVSDLIRKGRFISLELNNEYPFLSYLDEGEQVTLMLEDHPRIQQIFWNGHFFKPRLTDFRFQDLVFFVRWLHNNNIRYEFADMRDLTMLTLNDKHRIKLCYKYLLSVSDVLEMTLEEGDIVVNLHNWNGAPTSGDAEKYADQIGVRLFDQNEFFTFAHKNIK